MPGKPVQGIFFLSNRLTYAAICGLIVPGGEPPAILTLVMNQPPGVAAPLTGAFSLPVLQEMQKGPQALLAGLSYARRGTRTPTGLPIRSLV